MVKVLSFAVACLIAVPVMAQSGVQMSFGDSATRSTSYWQDAREYRNDFAGTGEYELEESNSFEEIEAIDEAYSQEMGRQAGKTENLVRPDSQSSPADTAVSANDQLPQLADVNSPIGMLPLGQLRQNDPNGLLGGSIGNYGDRQRTRQSVDQVSYSELTGYPSSYANSNWQPTDYYHEPTYFEDVNVERYGVQHPHQSLRSGIKFFATIPTLPFQIGRAGLGARQYSLRHDRPGDCVPSRGIDFTYDRRGAFWQGVAAAVIIVP